MFRRLCLTAGLLSMASPALAANCVVDFQKAVETTDEGKSAQSRMDTMLETRRGEMARMQSDLENEAKEFQQKAMILSEQARAEAEQALMAKQQRFQQTAMQYEGELAQTYNMLLSELGEKMRSLSITIAKERKCDILLDSAAVVYGGSSVDLTSELVTKYNAIHK
jgi:Skp family chaperone for outer membrane proteins